MNPRNSLLLTVAMIILALLVLGLMASVACGALPSLPVALSVALPGALPGVIDMNFKMFFTSKEVMAAVDKGTRQALSKAGAFIRTKARDLIKPARSKRDVALPGGAPKSHKGLLRKFILFSFDRSTRSVVVGPARLTGGTMYGPTPLPELMEEGGTVRGKDRGKSTQKHYAPHPYIGPAWEQAKPEVDQFWQGSVKA